MFYICDILNKKMSKLSIALPVYNGENFIKEAIESILLQDSLDFELVVVDNASTDNTLEIVKQFQLSDTRIKLIACENHVGQVENVNRSVTYCKSEWIHFFCHDDIMLKGCVVEIIKILNSLPKNNSIALISHQPAWLFMNNIIKAPFNPIENKTIMNYDYFYNHSQIVNVSYTTHLKKETAENILNGKSVYFPALTTAIVKKDVFLKLGMFDKKYIHFDIFLWMKLVKNYDYLETNVAMTLTRIHGAQVAVDARKTFRTLQDNKLFWKEYINYLDLPFNIKNRVFSFLKYATTATGILAVNVLKYGWLNSFKMLKYIPFWYWLFIIVYLPIRVKKEKKISKELLKFVPLEMIYP